MPKIHLEKFDPYDGSADYVFPLERYEYESTQGTRSPSLEAIGSHYAVRLRGTKDALKEVAHERVRCVYVGTAADYSDQDTAWDAARFIAAKYGRVWLLDSDSSTRRWAWAECVGVPEIGISWQQPGHLPLVFAFDRFSDWFAESAGSGSGTITSSGQTFSVSNSGNLQATRMTIRLRANTSTGFTNPVVVTNNTTGHKFATSHSAISSNSEVRLDTRRPAVEWSNDDGATYTDDFSNYLIAQLPAWQKVLTFGLNPGSNTIAVTSAGTVNVTVAFEFDAPFS